MRGRSADVTVHDRGGRKPPGARRGRPRSEAVERAIVEGVLRLLEEGCSLPDLTIERIAKVAGVGKATIYRRWPGKEALILDVLTALEGDPPPEPKGQSLRDDLVAVVESIRLRGITKRDSAVLRFMTTEVMRHPTMSRQYHDVVVERRRAVLFQVLRRGVDSGELRSDIDVELLSELFVGPMLVRTVLHEWAPLDKELAARIVDAVLEGVRTR